MSTQARIHANRLNAQKSTGPQTPQGKAVVSQNALKHGLSARHDVITTESQADFDLHRDALLAELHPQGPMESILADRIVSLSWRLKRADLIQNQAFDAINEKITNNSLANIAKSFGLKGLGFPQDETSDSRPDLILGRIAIKDFSNARVLDRLLMYERRIEHSLFKTTLELQRLRLLRNLEHPNATNVAPSAPPFSRRRHDDALTPNPTPHAGIHIHQEPIINNQSSIVNIENTPEPPQNHPTSTIQHPESSIEHPESSIEYPESSITAQNKPNFQNANTNTNPYPTERYGNITLRSAPKKQTQTKPPPPTQYAIRNTQYAVRNTKYEIQTLTNPSIYCSG